MCGRFSLAVCEKDLEKRFSLPFGEDYSPCYNISPGKRHPIVVRGEKRILLGKWGLVKGGKSLPHTRWERRDSQFWQSFSPLPCLIPVTGFFEWRQEDKQPFYFTKGGEIFSLAGFFFPKFFSFTLLTTKALPPFCEVHPRFPLILSKEGEKSWLELQKICSEVSRLYFYPVSQEVNSPFKEGRELIQPKEVQQRLLF